MHRGLVVDPYFEVTVNPVPVSSLGFKGRDCFIWNCSYIVYPSKMRGPFREVGPLLNPLNNTLTDNKYEMCCLLVNQFNSVFTKPKQTSVIKDPVTFFLSHTIREDDLFLTDITLSDSIIIEAIKELSPNSAGGPDGIPASLLINCAEEIAPDLKIIFSHSLSSSLIPTSF